MGEIMPEKNIDIEYELIEEAVLARLEAQGDFTSFIRILKEKRDDIQLKEQFVDTVKEFLYLVEYFFEKQLERDCHSAE